MCLSWLYIWLFVLGQVRDILHVLRYVHLTGEGKLGKMEGGGGGGGYLNTENSLRSWATLFINSLVFAF